LIFPRQCFKAFRTVLIEGPIKLKTHGMVFEHGVNYPCK